MHTTRSRNHHVTLSVCAHSAIEFPTLHLVLRIITMWYKLITENLYKSKSSAHRLR